MTKSEKLHLQHLSTVADKGREWKAKYESARASDARFRAEVRRIESLPESQAVHKACRAAENITGEDMRIVINTRAK